MNTAATLQNFQCLPEQAYLGRTRFTSSRPEILSDLLRKMEEAGLFASLDRQDMEVFENVRERSCEVLCDGATGYFLDEDGLEASSTDVETFLLSILEDRDTFSISGHYEDGFGGRITNEVKYQRKGDRILTDNTRSHKSQAGLQNMLMELSEITDFRIDELCQDPKIVSFTRFKARR